MPLTVASLEADLLVLLGPTLEKVGLDGTTADGTNDSLRIPIRRAVRRMGIDIADGSTVADADLAGVEGDDGETLLDLAELKTLEICWGNWPEVDQSAGEERQFMNQLADRILKRIEKLKESLGPLADDATAATANGAAASALLRTGLEYPPPEASPYSRRTFYHDGKYYR